MMFCHLRIFFRLICFPKISEFTKKVFFQVWLEIDAWSFIIQGFCYIWIADNVMVTIMINLLFKEQYNMVINQKQYQFTRRCFGKKVDNKSKYLRDQSKLLKVLSKQTEGLKTFFAFVTSRLSSILSAQTCSYKCPNVLPPCLFTQVFQ